MKPPEIHDRDAEWAALEALWKRSRPQLAFVLGRHRVGKSYVLSRFTRGVCGVYYQATKRTEGEQLAHLSRIIGEHFGDPALRHGVTFASWERLFEYLTDRAGTEPFLLALDEFPYLVAAAPALPSILQSAWDHQWPGTRIKIVLSGSFVTAMRKLEEADQPLYGRRTARLLFGPFTFADAGAFMPGYDFADRLTAYAVFGHLPGHLALIDPAAPVAENAAAAALDPTGPLADDAQHMLDAFLPDARVHYSILEAIATGDRTWSGITRRVGQSGGSLLRPLRWLEEMGLVEHVVPITEKTPQRSRRGLYRLCDPYVTFWHRFVSPLIHSGSLGLVPPDRLWSQLIAPRLDDHLGPVFEDACRQFVRQSDRLPFAPIRVGEWWDPASNHQVDIVALDPDGRLLVAECKLGTIRRGDLASLRLRAQRIVVALGGAPEIHLALFSGRDEADETVRAAITAGEVLYFTGQDIAQP